MNGLTKSMVLAAVACSALAGLAQPCAAQLGVLNATGTITFEVDDFADGVGNPRNVVTVGPAAIPVFPLSLELGPTFDLSGTAADTGFTWGVDPIFGQEFYQTTLPSHLTQGPATRAEAVLDIDFELNYTAGPAGVPAHNTPAFYSLLINVLPGAPADPAPYFSFTALAGYKINGGIVGFPLLLSYDSRTDPAFPGFGVPYVRTLVSGRAVPALAAGDVLTVTGFVTFAGDPASGQVTVVPEPATLALMAFGVIGVLVVRRARRTIR